MPYAPLRPCLLVLTITLSIAGHLPNKAPRAFLTCLPRPWA